MGAAARRVRVSCSAFHLRAAFSALAWYSAVVIAVGSILEFYRYFSLFC